MERKGKVIPCTGPKMEKDNSGKSGTRNLEAESIRNRAESIRGCVELRTVTDIRQSSAFDTFIAEGVFILYLIICVIGSQWRD